jgi:hypothetical protein
MTHQLYTEQQLLSKTLSELKTIYTQIGAAVEVGDKRSKSAWVNAIIAHQSLQVESISDDISIEAIGYTLQYDPNSAADKKTYQVFDSFTQEPLFEIYQTLNGWTNDLSKQAHICPKLAIAEAREKTIGRIERSRPLQVEQIDNNTFVVCNPDNGNHYAVHPSHPNHHERCECGDAHFRGAHCKHQIAANDYLQESITAAIAQAELNQYIEQQALEIAPNAPCSTPDILFTSADGFYNWEATVDGKTIATIHYDGEHLTQRYVVAVGGTEIFRWNTQARAERHIQTHYKQGTLPVAEEEKPESCTIEDCKFVDNKGQQYAFRIDNQLIGWIWLTDDGGDWYSSQEYWINGDGTKYDDWHECGLKLAQLTRNDLYELVAA